MGAPNASTPSIASLSLTPARCRDLDQDMQALRLSRQDNPFIQKVIESRESLADTLEESVSDDAILMSQVNVPIIDHIQNNLIKTVCYRNSFPILNPKIRLLSLKYKSI